MTVRKFLRRISSRRFKKITLLQLSELLDGNDMLVDIFWTLYPHLIENK